MDRSTLREISVAAIELAKEANLVQNKNNAWTDEIVGPVAAALISAALDDRNVAEALTGKTYP